VAGIDRPPAVVPTLAAKSTGPSIDSPTRRRLARSTRVLASPGRSRNRARSQAMVEVAPRRRPRSRASASRTNRNPNAACRAANASQATIAAARSSSDSDHTSAPGVVSNASPTASSAATTG
jgi:hypothetical protein